MTLATTKAYAIKSTSTSHQIVDIEDDFVVFQTDDPRKAAAEFRRLSGGVSAPGALWELDAAKRFRARHSVTPDARYVRVFIVIKACDKNIDRVRALYREIKGKEFDESRTHELGYYRYPPGPRNVNPEQERQFGHRIEFRARYYATDGTVVERDSMEEVINLLYAGYDLGYNDLQAS